MDEKKEDKQPTLSGVPVTPEQLQEEKTNLKNDERIVEVKDNDFRKLHRMQE